jgi:hypothetical protein
MRRRFLAADLGGGLIDRFPCVSLIAVAPAHPRNGRGGAPAVWRRVDEYVSSQRCRWLPVQFIVQFLVQSLRAECFGK